LNIAINAINAKIAGIEMNTFETRRKGGSGGKRNYRGFWWTNAVEI
jgi:hypothetical protein